MADMADFTLETVEQFENLRFDYRSGNMSLNDAYEYGIIDELGNELTSIKTVTCRCCNKSGLTWGKHANKWLLFENNNLHKCPINPLRE